MLTRLADDGTLLYWFNNEWVSWDYVHFYGYTREPAEIINVLTQNLIPTTIRKDKSDDTYWVTYDGVTGWWSNLIEMTGKYVDTGEVSTFYKYNEQLELRKYRGWGDYYPYSGSMKGVWDLWQDFGITTYQTQPYLMTGGVVVAWYDEETEMYWDDREGKKFWSADAPVMEGGTAGTIYGEVSGKQLQHSNATLVESGSHVFGMMEKYVPSTAIEAWTTETGTVNAQIPRYSYLTCFDPATGDYIVIEPWDYTYALNEICSIIDGREVWMPADRTLIDVMYNSEVKLSIYSSYATQISKIRYTKTPRDYYHMVGYSMHSAYTTAQYLSDSPLTPEDAFYFYRDNAALIKRSDQDDLRYLSRFRIHKVTNVVTGEEIPVQPAFHKDQLDYMGIWVYKIAVYYGSFPWNAVFKFEYGIED